MNKPILHCNNHGYILRRKGAGTVQIVTNIALPRKILSGRNSKIPPSWKPTAMTALLLLFLSVYTTT